MFAYHGNYTEETEKGVVTHHVLGSSVPWWTGGNQVRTFKLEEPNLTIEGKFGEIKMELLWKRIIKGRLTLEQ